MSANINSVCARAVNTLGKLNKEVLTAEDVETALRNARIDSTDGRRKYTEASGYLTGGGWLIRVIGGWTLAPEAIPTGIIIIKVVPGMATVRVFNKVSEALKPFKGFTEVRMEV